MRPSGGDKNQGNIRMSRGKHAACIHEAYTSSAHQAIGDVDIGFATITWTVYAKLYLEYHVALVHGPKLFANISA